MITLRHNRVDLALHELRPGRSGSPLLLLHGLGDPNEALLAAGLAVLAGEPCLENKARLPFAAARPEAELPGRFPETPGLY